MNDALHLKRHTISFKNALNGLLYTFSTQPNLRIHLTLGLGVIILATFLHVSWLEWLILLFTIMWVLTAEMINTALESIVNLVTQEYHLQAKIAKDVSAGMVLVGAIGAVIVGLAIFIPHLL